MVDFVGKWEKNHLIYILKLRVLEMTCGEKAFCVDFGYLFSL